VEGKGVWLRRGCGWLEVEVDAIEHRDPHTLQMTASAIFDVCFDFRQPDKIFAPRLGLLFWPFFTAFPGCLGENHRSKRIAANSVVNS